MRNIHDLKWSKNLDDCKTSHGGSLVRVGLLQNGLVQKNTKLGRTPANGDASVLQSLDLGLGGAFTAGDETDNWLGVGARVVLLEVVGGHLLGLATDLAD